MAPRILAFLLLAACLSQAHLDSLITPKPGIGYPAGGSLLIQWTIGNNHNGIDVHLSTDDKTWTPVVSDLAKTVTRYSWTLPAKAADRARIRICQKSGPQGCTDADSVSNPADGPIYTLVSGRFRIETASTALRPLPAQPSAERLLLPALPGHFLPQGGAGFRDLRGRSLALPRR